MPRWIARAFDVLLVAFLLAMVFTTSPAFAGCRTNDRWHGDDKKMHAFAGAGISFFATLHTADPWQGFLWGAGAGLAKEAIDATGQGDCSLQDFAVTGIAAGVAAYTGGVIVTRVQGRTLVAYMGTF